jgi:predicted DNA-binding transcriptional regulator YafY
MAKKQYDKRPFRMIDIVYKLSKYGSLDVNDLCQEYGVGIRTLQKDVKELNLIFNDAIIKKDGFYRFKDDFSIKNLPLKTDELKVLHSVLSIFDKENYFGEIGEYLKERLLNENLNNPYYIKQKIEDIAVYEEIHKTLANAIEKSYIVNILYCDEKIKVEPYKLANFDGFWYLLAKDFEKNKLRTYMLSKIGNVEITYEKYIVKKERIEFLLKNHVQSSWFEDGISFEVKVKIYANIADYFKQKKFIKSQKILNEYENGDILVSFKISHPEDIDNTIKSWLPDIEVLEPQWYKEQIEEELENYIKRLKNT